MTPDPARTGVGVVFVSSLLAVDGTRIELAPNRSYVLGRSRDCEILVADISCSRKHARITVGGEGRNVLFIEDLGSRNGTYLNDERIWDRTAVTDGCLLRMGASVFMLSTAAGDRGHGMLDTGTVAIEKLSYGTDLDPSMARVLRRDGPEVTNFAGKLESLGLLDILQLIMLHRRDGTLYIKLRGGIGTIDVRDGEVCSAAFEELVGFQALLLLARERAGTFWMAESSKSCRNTIQEPAANLLVMLCKAMDES